MSGSVYFEGNAFIDGGQAQNITLTSSSVSSCVITTSSLDMNLANITSVKDPINPQDAATKLYVDNLNIVYTNVSLSGTNSSVISNALKGTFSIFVTNLIINGPSAKFDVTKNEASNNAHIVRTVACPGVNSSTTLIVTWPPNSGILMNKSGTDFDGSYKVKFV